MSKKTKSLEYTCIFGGGAIRGVSYVGAVRALEELNIQLGTICGSSVGAVFGGLLAVGYNAEELKGIFMQINYELFKDIHFGFGKDFALSKGGIFLDWLRDLIEKKYYGDRYVKGENPPVTFADLEKDFIVIATDLTNFKYKEFSKYETPEVEVAYAIRVSSTMPGLMKPVEENGSLLVDGDLQKSWPLWRLSENMCKNCERILEFRLEGDYEGIGQNTIDFMNTVYSCVTSLATDYIIETYGHNDKYDYIKINTGGVVVVDFNQSKKKRLEMMDFGYMQTRDYFVNLLPIKKKEIVRHYKLLAKHISKIKKYIFENKIKKAKDQLGSLYIDFCESKDFIDDKYSLMINKFKEDFFENIKSASLLGVYTLSNHKSIYAQIDSIDAVFAKQIIELENYIFDL